MNLRDTLEAAQDRLRDALEIIGAVDDEPDLPVTVGQSFRACVDLHRELGPAEMGKIIQDAFAPTGFREPIPPARVENPPGSVRFDVGLVAKPGSVLFEQRWTCKDCQNTGHALNCVAPSVCPACGSIAIDIT